MSDFMIENGVLTKYTGNGGDIIIPNGVTRIGTGVFKGCTSLTSIIIPNSVKTIGGGVFKGCTSLTSIIIPNSVKTIGGGAFKGCTNLTSVTIGNRVTTIGWYAFAGCTSLTSVTIPDSVRSIEGYAFRRCTSLKSVTIPDSVTSIGDYAFLGCENLTSVTIPDSVTSIGDFAFGGTPWLAEQQKKSPLVIVNDILIEGRTCSGNVIIPDNVKTIVYGVFGGYTSLTSVTYRGVVINKDYQHGERWSEIFKMLINRDFSVKMNLDVKYSVIGSFYSHNPDDEPTIAYIKKNFGKMFQYFIDKNDIETVTAIVNSGKFLTKRNIVKYITYAIDSGKYFFILYYFKKTRDETVKKVLQEYILEIFPPILKMNDIEAIQTLSEEDGIITEENIDFLIELAIDDEKHEIYVILLNYKAEKIGFEDIADQFKL